MIQPPEVPQLVSSTFVPGRYLRAAGTSTSAGPSRKPPASRSRIAPNTLGESNRGRQSHSTFPFGATSAQVSQSDRNAYSAIGGNGLAVTPRSGAHSVTTAPPPPGRAAPPPRHP